VQADGTIWLQPWAKTQDACLIVQFALQHVGEAAIYEGQTSQDVVPDPVDPGNPKSSAPARRKPRWCRCG